MKRFGQILLFLGAAFLPALSAVTVQTGGWYAALNKPAWNPPSWVFGPVWSILYLMIGLAGYFAWARGGREGRRKAFAVYAVQLALNALWTPLFFGLHRIGWALADLILLWILVLVCIDLFARRSRPSVSLLIPYFLWISFAAVLNAAILLLN